MKTSIAQVAISKAELVLRINAAGKHLLHLMLTFCNHRSTSVSSVSSRFEPLTAFLTQLANDPLLTSNLQHLPKIIKRKLLFPAAFRKG